MSAQLNSRNTVRLTKNKKAPVRFAKQISVCRKQLSEEEALGDFRLVRIWAERCANADFGASPFGGTR